VDVTVASPPDVEHYRYELSERPAPNPLSGCKMEFLADFPDGNAVLG
jgi:hypothetical protein